MRIYTDASTRSNISGIAFVATTNKNEKLYKKGMVIEEADNNTAELSAILFGIRDIKKYLRKNEHLTILTDSSYTIQAINGGHTRIHEEKIIKAIQNEMNEIKAQLMWVKGHCQDGTILSYFNKQADKMSKTVRKEYEKEFKKIKKQNKLIIISKSKTKE